MGDHVSARDHTAERWQGASVLEHRRESAPARVQVVIALVVTPEGLPLAYEVLPGNTVKWSN